ncbi:MAG: membrane protein insertase YidC [Candidatus Cryptobacteroides sp.]|nr:membrane protein insertase YidC [Candidatus Cryptobacteroides sp.]
MDKNSVTGFILIACILFGFTFYQSKQVQKQARAQAVADSIALAERIARGDTLDLSAAASSPETVVQLSASSSPAGASPAQGIYKDAALNEAAVAEPSIVVLENDKLRIGFNTKGAQPDFVQVKDYRNYDSTDLYIFKPGNSEYSVNVYAGEYVNTSNFVFQVAEQTDSTLVMRLPFACGGYIEQSYSLSRGSYAVGNALSFVGMDGVIPRNVSSIDIDYSMLIPRMEKGYKNEVQYSKLDYYFEGDKKPVEMGRGRNAQKRIDTRLSWFAFQQQFFSAIIRAPRQFASGELSVNYLPEQDPERNLMRCTARMRADLDAGRDVSIPFEFYFGPNHFQTLKSFGHKYEKIIPLGGWLVGWFTRFVIIPMFNFFNRFIGNFGIIILLMTIVIKLVVTPFTYKSYASSAKMSALKPELDKINAKYPKQEDAMKKQQATMDLYKRAGVSPMGGCLPMQLSFPIISAMFRFFPASIELRQQSFLWCHDLSAYDAIVEFGTRIPILGDHISLFALLMAVTMWGYSKFTMAGQPNANDPSAASMRFMSVWMMPIMMFFICNSLSAALSYYYLLSQLIAILQTWIIRKSVNKEAILEKVRLSYSKPMPKSKWQQRLEEAQRLQEQQMRQQRRK